MVRSGHVNDDAHVGSTLVRALQELGEDAVLVDPPKPWGHLPHLAKAAIAIGPPTDDFGVLSTQP